MSSTRRRERTAWASTGRRFAPLFVLALLLLPPGAKASEQEDEGTFNVTIENDRVAKTDRHYTNGIRLSYLTAANDAPASLLDLARELPIFARGADTRIGYALGQSIFTPADTATRSVVADDRPYAGWLYGGFALLSDSGRELRTIELDLGVVGPYALGEETQNTWHDIIQVDRANGWGNQLGNEPGAVLYYEHKWRQLFEFTREGLGVDLMPHAGAALGNVFTYAAGGATLRFGEDLPSDYGPPRIRPSLPGSTFFLPRETFGWYLFAGLEGRLVLRNIFLDGNSFGDSHSVDKKRLVGDFQIGAAVTVDRFRLAYTQVFRTPEFDGQEGADRFGAVSLSVKF